MMPGLPVSVWGVVLGWAALCWAPIPAASAGGAARPNIVFLVVESTDGRTWTPGYSNGALPIPNIRLLQERGYAFTRHYSNAPVCCPSRATFWSGRHASNIQHSHGNISVGGVWNNYEGLPAGFADRIDQVLNRSGYDVLMSGKFDWDTAGHGESPRFTDLALWTMYTGFPYDIPRTGGWASEVTGGKCDTTGEVKPGNASAHQSDWAVVDKNVAWLAKRSPDQPPFFIYQGMNIVHPPYATSEAWLAKINQSLVTVPEWRPLTELHPCDLQSSMLKGCIPPGGTTSPEAKQFYSESRRRHIRSIYLAMIAEFDAMVGKYIEVLKDTPLWDNTVWIVTSDHGDMQMEHQQFYKMTPYDASASVPMVVFHPKLPSPSPLTQVAQPTQLIDIMPTILDLAQVPASARPSGLDGHSLLPLLSGASLDGSRPAFVVSQFHGKNIAMSWYLAVQRLPNGSSVKLIQWGTGQEVPSLLFNLDNDPGETTNLVHSAEGPALVATLQASIRSVVDYNTVSQAVADYNRQIFVEWTRNTTAAGQDWRQLIAKETFWADSWATNASASLAAVEAWMAEPARVRPCRSALVAPTV